MVTGTVKWFNKEKGYGFISPEGGGKDVFVHITALEKAGIHMLREGDSVTFETKNSPKSGKPEAINLKASRAA